jgi:hypothetical protein
VRKPVRRGPARHGHQPQYGAGEMARMTAPAPNSGANGRLRTCSGRLIGGDSEVSVEGLPEEPAELMEAVLAGLKPQLPPSRR